MMKRKKERKNNEKTREKKYCKNNNPEISRSKSNLKKYLKHLRDLTKIKKINRHNRRKCAAKSQCQDQSRRGLIKYVCELIIIN